MEEFDIAGLMAQLTKLLDDSPQEPPQQPLIARLK